MTITCDSCEIEAVHILSKIVCYSPKKTKGITNEAENKEEQNEDGV